MKGYISILKKIISYQYFPILALIILNLIVGICIVRDYGESIDEKYLYLYADDSLNTYFGWITPIEVGDYWESALKYYGPFYVMVARITVGIILCIYKGWPTIVAWHFVHFLTFQFGLFFFYKLCKRFMSPKAALGATLLFETQPLLWGHSFINPKDVPFMVFFLVSIEVGLWMVDSFTSKYISKLEDSLATISLAEIWRAWVSSFSADWLRAKASTKRLHLSLCGCALFWFIMAVASKGFIPNLIRNAYYSESTSVIGILFSKFAAHSNSISVGNYIQKGQNIYSHFLVVYGLATLGFIIILCVFLFRTTAHWIWRYQTKPFIAKTLFSMTRGSLISAGILLGVSTSIRFAGPVVGLLVGGMFILKVGRKSLPALLAYFIVMLLTVYITWPYLWESPVSRFIDTMFYLSTVQGDYKTRFFGIEYSINNIPGSYLPVLILLQFTEPVIALFFIGTVIVVGKVYRGLLDKPLVWLAFVWFFFPLVFIFALRPNVFNNFRHYLFIIPPVFIFTGVTLDALLCKIKNKVISSVFLIALLLPGIYWGIKLHPYEYVYYNSFVGGVRGAFRKFDLDYWSISLKEATEYIDEVASKDANIIVSKPAHLVKDYAREDLRIKEYSNAEDLSVYDYGIFLTNRNKDIYLYPDADVIFSVVRDGATFVVVKKLR
jgi:hypothetical protein